MVLTCRTTHLDALAAREALRDAARVDLSPVPAADALTYLRARAADPVRWRPLTEHLATTPPAPWPRCCPRRGGCA
ncbi:hypothetical protein OHB05_38920 [Streptomyces sp. NBC_00638]|uniref:hypothetical protein n=1 Tax=unclassified Streptomyces TaxID=2593676 RepID=UPI00224E4447|nr:hypothetical protein [Streptomyces sp. NBC_00638]MCX5008534.1 hypothetical protein [Streptomyces sp. NBC_00638]